MYGKETGLHQEGAVPVKRPLAIAVVVCTLGFAGFSQIAIRGSWTGTVRLLPSPVILDSKLSLSYTVAGFDITSVTELKATRLTSQEFALKGKFGQFSLTGSMEFAPTPPRYKKSELTSTFDFGGIAISLNVTHSIARLLHCPTAPSLSYTLAATVSPVTVRARFRDCSTGTAFHDLRMTLRRIDLCCGITYDAELDFTKAGFDKLVLRGVNIPLCCGVSFDVAVTGKLTAKSVRVTPKFAGIGKACLTVWAAPIVRDIRFWEGIRVDGFRIRCALGDCNYLEYVHAWHKPGVPKAIRDKFVSPENEYLELGFCGPGCCGGRWTATLRVLWTTTPTAHGNGIFGTTRLVGAVSIPIMTNFTASLGFTMPTMVLPAVATPDPFAGARPAFTFGWTFTF